MDTKILISKGKRNTFLVDYFSTKENFSIGGTLDSISESLGVMVREYIIPTSDYETILNKLFLYFIKIL